MTKKVTVSQVIIDGLEAVRASGRTNMLDITGAIDTAIYLHEMEAAAWIDENRTLYARGIFQGFTAEESDVIKAGEEAAAKLDRGKHGPAL